MPTSRDEILTSTTPIEIGSATHVGRVRSNNEDSYRVVPAHKLFVLSDGIGGQANGEVASAMAVETIVTHCLELPTDRSSWNGEEPPSGNSDKTNHLVKAAYLANRTILGASVNDPRFRGMGATLVAAWIDGPRLSLVHVGDSRAYLFRGGDLESLTSDHTLVAEQVRSGLLTVEQAQTNPLRRILIRALGAREEVEIDIHEHELRAGDVLLLCTDGLTGMVSDSEIADVLLHESDAQRAADCLIASANDHGGEDNVTVILVRIGASAGQNGL
jgi:serine/threonine protein phosphatase PrpC